MSLQANIIGLSLGYALLAVLLLLAVVRTRLPWPLKAAAVALTVAMVIKTGRKCLTGLVPVGFFAAAFVLNGLLRWPLLLTLVILAPLCLVWAWPRARPA